MKHDQRFKPFDVAPQIALHTRAVRRALASPACGSLRARSVLPASARRPDRRRKARAASARLQLRESVFGLLQFFLQFAWRRSMLRCASSPSRRRASISAVAFARERSDTKRIRAAQHVDGVQSEARRCRAAAAALLDRPRTRLRGNRCRRRSRSAPALPSASARCADALLGAAGRPARFASGAPVPRIRRSSGTRVQLEAQRDGLDAPAWRPIVDEIRTATAASARLAPRPCAWFGRWCAPANAVSDARRVR